MHSVLSFSLPHSTDDGRWNGRGDCGSETCGEPATRGLPLLWYFLISFLILDLIALIVVWVCGIFVNILWVCVSVINDNIYGFVFALLTCYGLMGIDFSVNML